MGQNFGFILETIKLANLCQAFIHNIYKKNNIFSIFLIRFKVLHRK